MSHIVEQHAEGLALVERTVVLGDEEERHALLFQDNLLTAKQLSETAQGYHAHQLFTTGGHGTEAVYQAGAVGCHLFVCLQAVQLPIEQHALRVAGHILVGEVELEIGLEGSLSPSLSKRRRSRGSDSAPPFFL